jgi:hypothetical protein
MTDCLASTGLSRRGIARRLEIAGCRIDFAIGAVAEASGVSAEAARLAEELVASRVGCDRRLVRVAALMPSGRPIATVRGRPAAVSVSVSHFGGAIGAACCDTAGVGIDIVDPAEAGRSLDVWFRPHERALLANGDGLLRARLWGSKEAAFKASRLDDGFRPCSVDIDDLGRTGFRWSVRGAHGPVRGHGIFTSAGVHVVAVAVAADRRPDAAESHTDHRQESLT